MQKILWIVLLSISTLWACPMGGCAQKAMDGMGCHAKGKKGHFLRGITQVLNKMGKSEDADIKMALYSYQMGMKSAPRGLPLEAFKEEGFDKTYYLEHSRQNFKAHAQADLIETIYSALNEQEKKTFAKEVRSYQEERFKAMQGGNACPMKGSGQGMNAAACSSCAVKCMCEGQKSCSCGPDCGCAKCKAMKRP